MAMQDVRAKSFLTLGESLHCSLETSVDVAYVLDSTLRYAPLILYYTYIRQYIR